MILRCGFNRVLGTDNWVTVPTNSTLTIHKQTVMIHPIIDEYYNHNPAYERSSGFAVSKGLVSNAPGATTGGKEGEKEVEVEKELREKLRVVTQGVGMVGASDSESE